MFALNFFAFNRNAMQRIMTSCYRIGVLPKCKHCQSEKVIRSGRSVNAKQRFLCKACGKRFIADYQYRAYHTEINDLIIRLTKEGLGIRSTARILHISATTVLKRMLRIAQGLKRPILIKVKSYEVDEIRSFIKCKDKLIWIVYALERKSKEVVTFSIGVRTNKTLQAVLKALSLSEARHVYTDNLANYRYLVDASVHRTDQYGTNHIERKNLTLRTHLKRLNRRSICFSKSIIMLRACLQIYFFS